MKRAAARSFAAALTGFFLFSSYALSAQYDLKTMTPEVQAALAGRQARYDTLQSLKSQGAIGENSRGYVEALNQLPEAVSLVTVENADRGTIYQAIAQQNNLGPSGLAIVETVFAEVHHEKSGPGQWIQSSDGRWVQKQ